MLEFNLYDNFNPNLVFSKKIVKARGVAMKYELWQTGYKYTSQATLSIKAEIGDIVEILLDEQNTYIINQAGTIITNDLNLLFVVTDIDSDNKATLKNYFWVMLEGVEVPTRILSGESLDVLKTITAKKNVSLVNNGFMANSQEMQKKIKYNRKSDTDTAEKIAKDMFRVIKRQPIMALANDTLVANLLSHQWVRQPILTMIDIKQNPSIEFETLVERSNYNFLNVYVKNSDETYPTSPARYTINDNNEVISMDTYTGLGDDLPSQRIIKTQFFDEQPTNAEIKALISKDTVVANIFFNKNELMPLVVNDLVSMYYQGQLYQGYIADRAFFESDGGLINERMLFVEGASE